MTIRNLKADKPNIFKRIWAKIMTILFRLNILLTFLGILPVTLFIYKNLIYFNPIRILVGCALLLTLIHSNKSIQG